MRQVWAAVTDADARRADEAARRKGQPGRGLPGMGHEMYCKLFQLRPELQAHIHTHMHICDTYIPAGCSYPANCSTVYDTRRAHRVHTASAPAAQAAAFAGFDLVMLDEAHDCTACQVVTTPYTPYQPLKARYNRYNTSRRRAHYHLPDRRGCARAVPPHRGVR